MKLIVGLGNPGEKYQNTRHNIGFLALDALLEKFEPLDKTFWEGKKDLKSNIKYLRATDLMLTKPSTFMNESGTAISKVLNYYKIDPQNMIVIHDDSDLPFGKIRVRFGGASGGHRGVQSIIDTLNTDKFLRIRLGIGSPTKVQSSKFKVQSSLDRYVLAPFSAKERNDIRHMIKETVRTVQLILKHGLESYMSKYNK